MTQCLCSDSAGRVQLRVGVEIVSEGGHRLPEREVNPAESTRRFAGLVLKNRGRSVLLELPLQSHADRTYFSS